MISPFVADPVLREMIWLDIFAISTDLHSGEWKGATVLAGSCCEALLLYGIQTCEGNAPGSVVKMVAAAWSGSNAPDAADLMHRSWDLFAYTEAAHNLGLITNPTKCELGPARDHRNLIHPGKPIREKIRCDRERRSSLLARLSMLFPIYGGTCNPERRMQTTPMDTLLSSAR